ncbi:MAG: hypothetical protein QOF57_511 [Frankiaceae bacterium]|nr:hypothetical protein [Frankiaceae bacterium]
MPENAAPATGSASKPTSVRRVLVRWVTVAAAVVTIGAAGFYGSTQGSAAAIGAVVGGVLVAAFFVSGVTLATLSTRPEQPEGQVLIYALGGYTAQVVGLFLVMIVFRHTSLFDHRAFGITILLATVVALVAAVVGFARAKTPTIEPAVAVPAAQDRL